MDGWMDVKIEREREKERENQYSLRAFEIIDLLLFELNWPR